MNQYAKLMAPYDAAQHERISQDTWGDLAPVKNTSYKGIIVFAKSCYHSGTIYIINSEFVGLEHSPWLFEAMHEQLNDYALKEGCVYKLKCTFRNYRFYGTPKLVPIN